MNLDEAERFGQDGIMSRQTVSSNLSAALAEFGSQRPERIASQFVHRSLRVRPLWTIFHGALGNLRRERWGMQVLLAHGSGA